MDKKTISMINNAQGYHLENLIKTSCKYYEDKNIAKIIKCYEPFRVIKKEAGGKFKGQFIEKTAQPDFFGINLKTGKTIIFEAKFTIDNKFKIGCLLTEQFHTLKKYTEAGAYAGVCACIDKDYYFIPFKDILEAREKKKGSISKEELEEYRLSFDNGVLLFLKEI